MKNYTPSLVVLIIGFIIFFLFAPRTSYVGQIKNTTNPDYQGYESAYDKGVEDTKIKYNLK